MADILMPNSTDTMPKLRKGSIMVTFLLLQKYMMILVTTATYKRVYLSFWFQKKG